MTAKSEYNDPQLLKLLRGSQQDQNLALEFIYKEYFPLVQKFIRENKGTPDDARDLFQETIIAFYGMVQQDRFRNESSIKTFLYSICKNHWNNWLKRRGHNLRFEDFIKLNPPVQPETPLEKYLTVEQNDQMAAWLLQIGERCKELLVLYYYLGSSMKEISDKMGFSDENSAKSQKAKCMAKLREVVS